MAQAIFEKLWEQHWGRKKGEQKTKDLNYMTAWILIGKAIFLEY